MLVVTSTVFKLCIIAEINDDDVCRRRVWQLTLLILLYSYDEVILSILVR